MFIPRSASPATTRPVPVAIIAVVLTTLLIALLMLAIFFWRTRRAASSDVEAHPEKKPVPIIAAADPSPRPVLRPLGLSQVPRAYTPFSSLPPRWSARFPRAPAPAVYSEEDEKTILPLYSARPAPLTAPVPPPRRYSSRAARREREFGAQGFERLDGRERGGVVGKLDGLMAKMRVEFKEVS